jgi:hypothetical protein
MITRGFLCATSALSVSLWLILFCSDEFTTETQRTLRTHRELLDSE